LVARVLARGERRRAHDYSAGEDSIFGDADDLSIDLNANWIRRRETLDELKAINQAIVLYNGRFQMSEPLTTEWPTAVTQLVSKGFLPSAGDYESDGWGAPYVADPPDKAPLVKVQSSSITNVASDKSDASDEDRPPSK
jgi:hypothetical protein